MARAQQHFVQAIELDPSYPEPHAQLGLADFLSVMMGKCPFRDVATRIRARAEEALSLAPDDPGPYFLLGAVAAAYDFDWPAAAAHFSAAVAGRSTSAEAHWAYASLYLQPLGHFQLAVHQMQEAVGRDPLNLMWRGVLVSHLTHAGLIDRAIQEAHAAIEIDPSSHIPRYTLGEAYAVLGRWRDAADTLREAYRLTPQDGLVIGTLAGVLRRMGDRSEAEVIMRSAGGQLLPVIGHVLYHALAHEIDEAAEWYDRAIAERDPFALIFAPSQVVHELRQSSHWPRLAARMHMEGAGPSASEEALSR
jgi:tetratricopeptide (TPR) repeat protein